MRKRVPIIPKIMRKNHLHIWKNFTIWDLVFTLVFAIIALLIGWGLNMLSTGGRVVVGLVIFCACEAMLLPVGDWDTRVYNKVWDGFKFLASKKHYAYRPNQSKSEPSKTVLSDKPESKDKKEAKKVKKGNK